MRADKLFYSATLVCTTFLIPLGLHAAVAQPPADPPPAEQAASPAAVPEAATQEKPQAEEQKKESEKPEEVVEQESRKSSDDASDSSHGDAQGDEEHKPLTEQQLSDAKAILTTSEQMVAAYEQGNADVGAAQFTEDAEYVDEQGNVYRGRAEIQRLLKEYFAEHPSCRLEIDVDSIRFVGDGVAMEDGETTLTHRDHVHQPENAATEQKTPQPGEADHQRPEVQRSQDSDTAPGDDQKDQQSDKPTPTDSAQGEDQSGKKPNGEVENGDKNQTANEPKRAPFAHADGSEAAPSEHPGIGEQPSIDSSSIDPSVLQDPDSDHQDGNAAVVRCRYSAVYQRVDGRWLIASIRDFPHEQRREHQSHLQSLHWLQGEWIDESDDSMVRFSCELADNGNFLIRTFAIVIDGQELLSGTQRIGWCPISGKLRSWIFDSEGGYADGFWLRDGNDWLLKCTGVTADGETASYTSVYRIENDHTISWQYVDYEVDGVRQPDSQVFTIVKSPPVPTPAVAGAER